MYGDQADRDLLEEAVRWVIITIIFVFDPLAVLLLIASQYTFRWRYIDAGGKPTPSKPTPPTTPKAPKPTPAPSGGQSLTKIVEKQKEVTSKPLSLSKISNAKPIVPKAPEEKTLSEMLNEGFEKEQKEREAEEQLERFKQREKEEKEALEEVARKAREEEVDYNKVEEQIKTSLETIEKETVKPGLTSAGLTLGGQVPKEPEPPMPLEQWNKMIEEAEKEVAKEDPKKKTSNYIMRAETGDKQVKIKDRVEE